MKRRDKLKKEWQKQQNIKKNNLSQDKSYGCHTMAKIRKFLMIKQIHKNETTSH